MKQIFTVFFIVTLFSCKKSSHCETWIFYDQCIPKGSTIPGCGTGPIETGSFCDDNLTGISPGATVTLQEDADAKHVRHFISKVP